MPKYVDYAEYYDFDHDTDFDVAFYLDYARQCGSPILELACGTGRILIPLAEAGFEMYGLDLSENMLAVCRHKVEEKGLTDRVLLTLGSMAAFDLPREDFALIYVAFRSFMHLYTQEDQIACLGQVYRHLQAGGYFVVDVFAPNYRTLAQEPDAPFAVTSEFELPNGHRVIRQFRFVKNDILAQINCAELRYEEYDTNGALVRGRTVPIATRYTFRYELQLLLERVGFQVVDIFRDYDKNPYDGTGEIIAVVRRP